MKRIVIAACMGMLLLTGHPVFAAIDSTALFDTKVLGTDIQKSTGSGVPVGTVIAWTSSENPEDAENWLECNGQSISPSVYLELFAIVGSRVPDLRNQFMRGGTSAQVGQVAGDTTRSHAHAMDQHTHAVTGNTSVTYVTKTGAPTEWLAISDSSTDWVSGSGGWVQVVNGSYDKYERNSYYAYASPIETKGSDSAVTSFFQYNKFTPDAIGASTAKMVNYVPYMRSDVAHSASGAVNGVAHASGPTSTHASGGAETAPQHIRVRYLIRALP